MVLSAAIFDLDGTLLDTLQDIADCMNRALRRNGLPVHPVDAYRTFVGNGVKVLARRVLPDDLRQDDALAGRILGEMEEEYGAHWADSSRLYAGIGGMLDGLVAAGARMAILSNKPHRFTRLIAERFFGAWPFDPVIGAREGGPHKPDPQAALEIARVWGLAPERVLYAGDTDADMLTGRGAGMHTVGVLWGFRTREELERTGAEATIREPRELLAWFGR